MPSPDRAVHHLPFVTLVAAMLVPAGPAGAGQSTPAPAQPAPLCAVSTDPDYARTPAKPAEVGGSPLYGAARQRRFLESLRGPEGQPVKFTRLPAVDAPDGETLIDRYEVTYEGIAKPDILHLDWYHYTEVRAPRGFVCGQAFNLGLPPPDPFMAADQLQHLALAEGGSAEFAPTSIDLGGGAAGAAFDHFRLLLRAAHAARQAGTPFVAGELPQPMARPHSVVVAYPQPCEGGARPASAIAMEDPRGRVTTPDSMQVRPEEIARLVPGLQAPAGSVAAVDVLSSWRAEPPRVNGAPLASPVVLRLTFGAAP